MITDFGQKDGFAGTIEVLAPEWVQGTKRAKPDLPDELIPGSGIAQIGIIGYIVLSSPPDIIHVSF